jgi:hypothetical protein
MPKEKLPNKDFIWTPKLAYAVGLLVTDGNLSSDGRHIIMRSAEPVMLETFKSCLSIQNKIGRCQKPDGNVTYRLQFGNIQLYNWLMKIGLSPAKSCTIGEIAIPDEFFRDYFRGCLDGDGSVQTYQDNYNTYKGRQYTTLRLFLRIVSASEKHIIWLQNKVGLLTGVYGFITKREYPDGRHATIFELKFAKKKSLHLIEWMYYSPDVPCLDRKRKIAQQAVQIIKNQQRRPYERVR